MQMQLTASISPNVTANTTNPRILYTIISILSCHSVQLVNVLFILNFIDHWSVKKGLIIKSECWSLTIFYLLLFYFISFILHHFYNVHFYSRYLQYFLCFFLFVCYYASLVHIMSL